MSNVPVRYLPKSLSRRDMTRQRKSLKQSRRAYRYGRYINRPHVKSFKSRKSDHIKKAETMYGIKSLRLNHDLAKRTRCRLAGLKKIMRKGQGAYYSSGSRPKQTAHSWGYARLASSITGGKAAAVDNHILEEYCEPTSRALRLSRQAKTRGIRRVKKTRL
jgi:hypothetical protein